MWEVWLNEYFKGTPTNHEILKFKKQNDSVFTGLGSSLTASKWLEQYLLKSDIKKPLTYIFSYPIGTTGCFYFIPKDGNIKEIYDDIAGPLFFSCSNLSAFSLEFNGVIDKAS